MSPPPCRRAVPSSCSKSRWRPVPAEPSGSPGCARRLRPRPARGRSIARSILPLPAPLDDSRGSSTARIGPARCHSSPALAAPSLHPLCIEAGLLAGATHPAVAVLLDPAADEVGLLPGFLIVPRTSPRPVCRRRQNSDTSPAYSDSAAPAWVTFPFRRASSLLDLSGLAASGNPSTAPADRLPRSPRREGSILGLARAGQAPSVAPPARPPPARRRKRPSPDLRSCETTDIGAWPDVLGPCRGPDAWSATPDRPAPCCRSLPRPLPSPCPG